MTNIKEIILPTAYSQAPVESIEAPSWMAKDIGSVINSVLSLILVIVALLAFGYFIWAGIEWMTAGGDQGKITKAKNKMTSTGVGLIVLASSYAFVQLLLWFLNVPGGLSGIWNFVKPINNDLYQSDWSGSYPDEDGEWINP